jgi:hypothetical protein
MESEQFIEKYINGELTKSDFVNQLGISNSFCSCEMTSLTKTLSRKLNYTFNESELKNQFRKNKPVKAVVNNLLNNTFFRKKIK